MGWDEVCGCCDELNFALDQSEGLRLSPNGAQTGACNNNSSNSSDGNSNQVCLAVLGYSTGNRMHLEAHVRTM